MGALADKYRAKPASLAAKYRANPATPVETDRAPLEASDLAAPARVTRDPLLKALDPYIGKDSQGGAIARGIVQGGTLGFGDELMGAIDAAAAGNAVLEVDPAVNPNGPAISKSWGAAQPAGTKPIIPESVPEAPSDEETYRRMRDRYRADNDASRRAFPKTYMGGEIAGGLAVPIPGGAAVKGAGILAKAKAAAPGAAALGAAYGLGSSEAELTDSKLDPMGAAKDAAVGAGFGAASTVPGAILGRGLDKLSARFGKVADDASAKAVGLRPGITNAAEQLGMTADDMRDLGRAAREEGLIPVFGSKEAVGKRAAGKMATEGQRIGEVYDELQKSGVAPDFAGIALDASKNIGAKNARDASGALIRDHLNRPVRVQTPLAPDQVRNMRDANKHIHDFVAAGEGPSPGGWDTVREMKSRAQKAVSQQWDVPLEEELFKDAVRGTTRGIENRVGGIVGPTQQAKLLDANRGYGLGADVSDLAEKAATREQALKSPSLGWGITTGLVSGGGAATMYGPGAGGAALALGVAMPFIKRLWERRGPAGVDKALALLEQKITAGARLPGATVRTAGAADPLEAHREAMSDPAYAAEVEAFLEQAADGGTPASKAITDRFGR